jgi:drug/metabolite transporter (DMT)-like permease
MTSLPVDAQTDATRRRERVGTMAAILCGAAWGSVNIVTKLAFRSGLNLGTLLGIRTVMSALLLWVVAYALRQVRRIPLPVALRLLVLGLIVYAPQSVLFNQALSRVPASIAVFGLYTYPTMVALLALALGRERLRPAKLAALTLSLMGIALVLSVSTEGIRAVGVLFALASAGVWAIFVIASHRTSEEVHPVVFTAFVLTGAAVSLFVGTATIGTMHVPTAHQWGWILLSAALPTVALGAFAAAMARVGATRASIGNTFDPPTTALLGALVLGEHLTPLQILGAGLVVGALAILPVAERQRPGASVPPLLASPEGSGESGEPIADLRTHP